MATAQDIIDEVRRIIHDETASAYRWSDGELLDYLNAGARQIVALLPEANTVEEIVQLTNNVARQVLPAGGIKFIKAARNYNDAGTAPQAVIRYVEKDVLDTYDLDWETDVTVKADGNDFFEHFCHDDREPTVYFIYPAASASKYIALVYSKTPTAMAAVGNTFPLADEYINGEVQYTVYRALTKESRDSMPSAFRTELWNNFLSALGLQRQAKDIVGPAEAGNRPPDAG